MRRMTVQEVHEHWQETITSLVSEGGILITLGNEEVAKLVATGRNVNAPRVDGTIRADKLGESPTEHFEFTKFDEDELAKWRDEVYGSETLDTLSALLVDRDDRFER